MNESDIELLTLHFDPGHTIPNNRDLPVLLYRQAKPGGSTDLASWWNQTFSRNGWKGIWRWTVFDYHHFHPDAHEVLGVARGFATLHFGGPDGDQVDVRAGDVVLLPAGTGHKRCSASNGFQVIGAYPPGQEHYSTNREMSVLSDSMFNRIHAVPIPENDPVFGNSGPLHTHWAQ